MRTVSETEGSNEIMHDIRVVVAWRISHNATPKIVAAYLRHLGRGPESQGTSVIRDFGMAA